MKVFNFQKWFSNHNKKREQKCERNETIGKKTERLREEEEKRRLGGRSTFRLSKIRISNFNHQ